MHACSPLFLLFVSDISLGFRRLEGSRRRALVVSPYESDENFSQAAPSMDQIIDGMTICTYSMKSESHTSLDENGLDEGVGETGET